jgi:Protein of unknown function (DUF1570)/Leucine Rich repeat
MPKFSINFTSWLCYFLGAGLLPSMIVAQDAMPDRSSVWIRSVDNKAGNPSATNDDWLEVLREAIDTTGEPWTNARATVIYQSLCRACVTRAATIPESRLIESTVLFPMKFDIQAKATQRHSLVGWPAGSYGLTASPHFSIATQGSAKQASDIARLCEQTYSIWRQIFFSHWCRAESLQRSIRSKIALDVPHQPKFQVIVFRNRDAYVKQLQQIEPNVAVSTGYYSPKWKAVFCYWDESTSMATLRHELTHQFFSQSSSEEKVPPEQLRSDFWIVEGLALYMESIQIESGAGFDVATLGGWDAARLQPARYRRLHDESWIPWDEFRRADSERFRSGEEIKAWYSQAAGLTHFWMDRNADERQAFIEYALSVYRGNPRSELLVDAQQDETLRRAYDRFLLLSSERLSEGPLFNGVKDIVLSRCPVSTKELLDWPAAQRKLDWFDLSFSKVDDRLFLEPNESPTHTPWDVRRLNVESTQVSDASIPVFAMMPRLEELDLSRCSITDDGLEKLRGHKALKTLWLTGNSGITDQGLAVLASLPKLEMTDLSGTSVTEEGWKKLLAKSPRLRRKKTSL